VNWKCTGTFGSRAYVQHNTDPVIRYHVTEFIKPKQAVPDVRGAAMIGDKRRRPREAHLALDREPRTGKFRRPGVSLLTSLATVFIQICGYAAGTAISLPFGAAEITRGTARSSLGSGRISRSEGKIPPLRTEKNRSRSREDSRRSDGRGVAEVKNTQLEPEPEKIKSGGRNRSPSVSEIERQLKGWSKTLEGSYPSRLEEAASQVH